MSSSPVRRIAVEAVVIVGSILLAFALDAWWDDRQEADRIDEVLDAVADEFDREILGLDSIIGVNRGVGAAEKALLDLTGPGRGVPGPDTIAALVAAGGVYEVYDPSFGAHAALLATGGLERVQDAELRSRLAGWSAELVDLLWERDQVWEATDRVLTSLEDSGRMSGVRELDDWWPVRLDATLESPTHREREARHTLLYSLYTDDLERIRRRAQEMQVAIREYRWGDR